MSLNRDCTTAHLARGTLVQKLGRFTKLIAQTSDHYWYRSRSCLSLIIRFVGTRKWFSEVKQGNPRNRKKSDTKKLSVF